VFVPIRYVYPSRTPLFQLPTIALGVIWGALMIAMLFQAPDVSRPIFWLSFVFPLYYATLSLVLHARRRGI
jgi:phosphatidylcholine synthase